MVNKGVKTREEVETNQMEGNDPKKTLRLTTKRTTMLLLAGDTLLQRMIMLLQITLTCHQPTLMYLLRHTLIILQALSLLITIRLQQCIHLHPVATLLRPDLLIHHNPLPHIRADRLNMPLHTLKWSAPVLLLQSHIPNKNLINWQRLFTSELRHKKMNSAFRRYSLTVINLSSLIRI